MRRREPETQVFAGPRGRVATVFCRLGTAVALLASGCNGTFYRPDSIDYHDPQADGLACDDLAIPTSDGLLLHGWRLKRAGPQRGVVLHFHGNAQNMTAHYVFVRWLALAGYEVVTFDYRGYGRSPGEPSRSGIALDAQAVLKFVSESGDFSARDLFVVAQSLGGAIAIPALAAAPPPGLRAVVIESSFASYRELAREKLSDFWLTWALSWPLSYLVTDEGRPGDHIGRIQVPVLMLHGDADPVVPFAHGHRLFAAAGAKAAWEFVTVAGGGHTPALAEGSRYHARILAFLARHGASAAGPPAAGSTRD